MFWTGVGVFVLSEVLGLLLDNLLMSEGAATMNETVLDLAFLLLLGLTIFGAALAAGAFVLRAVQAAVSSS